jgi:hypothetical protein
MHAHASVSENVTASPASPLPNGYAMPPAGAAVFVAGVPSPESLLAAWRADRAARVDARSLMDGLDGLRKQAYRAFDAALHRESSSEERAAMALAAAHPDGLAVGTSVWRGECVTGLWQVVEVPVEFASDDAPAEGPDNTDNAGEPVAGHACTAIREDGIGDLDDEVA